MSEALEWRVRILQLRIVAAGIATACWRFVLLGAIGGNVGGLYLSMIGFFTAIVSESVCTPIADSVTKRS